MASRERYGRWIGIVILVGTALLQPVTEYFGSEDLHRLLAKVVTLAIGIPVIVVLGSIVFRRAVRAPSGASAFAVVLGAAASAALFGALLLAVRTLSLDIDVLRPRAGLWGPIDALRIGLAMGLSTFALWALVLVFPIAVTASRLRSVELDALRAEAELAQTRAQFAPHFLLNTLSAISGLVTEEPRTARRMLATLGDLLRDSLSHSDELQPLEKQVEWLRGYAQILETRHAGQVTFRWEIDPPAQAAMLPRWVLQPLVENAVKHGALKQRAGGVVTVSATRAGDRVVCTIADNGPGLGPGAPRSGAMGLDLVRRRLAIEFGDAASLRLEAMDHESSGTRSIVEFPYVQ